MFRHLLLEMKAGPLPRRTSVLAPIAARRDTPLRPPFISFKTNQTKEERIIYMAPLAESDGRREVCLRPELQRGMETYLVRVPSDSKINYGNEDAHAYLVEIRKIP